MEYEKIVSLCIGKISGFDKYDYIMKNFNSVTLSSDSDEAKKFRKKYKGFYRVRRNDAWCGKYFDYFENNKSSNELTFDKIIDSIFKETDRIEASFSSKMLATINPDMPILDSQVMENMGLSIPTYGSKEKRLQSSKEVYKKITEKYQNYMLTDNCNTAIDLFDKLLPQYKHFSKTKKIDFYLWLLEYDELRSIGLFEGLIK